MNKPRVIFFAVSVIIFYLGFGITGNLFAQEKNAVPVVAESFTVPGAASEVLILSRGTEFKKNLRTALIEKLNEKHINVVVDKMDSADLHTPSNFDAVILLSGIQGFSPLPGAIDFIKKHNYPNNIVYVSTYNLFAAPYGRSLDKKKVDAVTAASKHLEGKKFEQVARFILERVFDLIGM